MLDSASIPVPGAGVSPLGVLRADCTVDTYSLGSRSEDVSVAVPVSATYESVEVFLGRERFKEALRFQERDRIEDEMKERVERIRLRIRMSEFDVEEPIVTVF